MCFRIVTYKNKVERMEIFPYKNCSDFKVFFGENKNPTQNDVKTLCDQEKGIT